MILSKTLPRASAAAASDDRIIAAYAAEKGFNIRILDVDAPLRAMNTLKMFAQKALSDFNGYSAACLANDKFCQKFIDMMDVLDGKELLTDTIEE